MPGKHTTGLDPEFVIMDEKGRPWASPNVIAWTKDIPFKHGNVEVFSDNANLEINVNPALTKAEFIENIRGALSIAKLVITNEYHLSAIAGLKYPAKQLKHPYCQEFGCEPDFDAYTVARNEVPEGAADQTFRSCGGHIHVGRKEGLDFLNTFEGKILTVKAMDAFVGLPSVLLDDDEASVARRSLYGKAGCHRPKPYGIEYRALSNFYLRNPTLAAFIYEATAIAVRSVDEGVAKKLDFSKIPEVINKGDIQGAEQLLQALVDYYPELSKEYWKVASMKSSRTKFEGLYESWGIK